MKIVNAIINYFKESRQELKKVAWLSRQEVINHTWVVIGMSLGVAIFLGLMDYLLNLGVQKVLGIS